MGRGAPGGSRVGGKDDVGAIAENYFLLFKKKSGSLFFSFSSALLHKERPLKKIPIKNKLTPGDILWFSILHKP